MQAGRQGKVAEVFVAKWNSHPFGSVHHRGIHDGCVVHEDVERAIPIRHERGHRRLIGEVEDSYADALVSRSRDRDDVVGCVPSGVQVSGPTRG
jgi:hypothetical protein